MFGSLQGAFAVIVQVRQSLLLLTTPGTMYVIVLGTECREWMVASFCNCYCEHRRSCSLRLLATQNFRHLLLTLDT